MKKFHNFFIYFYIVIIVLHTIIPFKEALVNIDNYIVFDSCQKFEDIFYDQECFQNGFYSLGGVSKAEVSLYGEAYYEDSIKLFDDAINFEFIALLKEGLYEPLSITDTYFLLLLLGYKNNFIHFVGTTGAFYKDSGYFNQETLNYALKNNNKVLQGNIVKYKDELYLLAEMSIDNKETIRADYPIPGYISTVSVFKIDEKTASKFLSSSDRFSCDSKQMIIVSDFDGEWIVEEIALFLLLVVTIIFSRRGH